MDNAEPSLIVWQCKSTHFFSISSVFVFFPQIFAGFCTLTHLHRGLHPDAHVRTYIVVEVYHIGDTLLRLPIVGEEFSVVYPLDLEDAVHALGDGGKATELYGIVEADETFLLASYKGDGKMFASGQAGRSARKRGGENHKQILSDELVCVPCALDRNGNAVSKVAKLGKCSTEAVTEVLGEHVNPTATLCTDGETSYRKFAKKNGNSLVQIKGGKGTVKGIYHIQHMNAYHSNLKNFLSQFKGISSKYLNNYLVWNNEIERRAVGLAEKAASTLRQVATAMFEESCSALTQRPALPLLVKNQS